MEPEEFAGSRTVTVSELLREGRFSIPDLQRNFAWTTVEADELWSDIEEFLALGSRGYYFIGNVILFLEDGRRVVVDGQQRMTTITLILCVVRDLIESGMASGIYGSDTTVRIHGTDYRLVDVQHLLRDALREPSLSGRWRLELKQRDRDRLVWIQKKPSERGPKPHGQGSPRIYKVHDYLSERCRKLLDSRGIDAVCEFAQTLLESVIMTRTRVDSLLTAYTIFTTINNRGKDLTLGDILRAEVLARWQRLAARDPPPRIVDALNEMDQLDYDAVAKFMRRYWIIKTGEKHSTTETARQVLQKVQRIASTTELEDFVADVGRLAAAYRQYIDIVEGGGLIPPHQRMAILATSKFEQQVPTLVAILSMRNSNSAEVIALIDVIEAIHVNHNLAASANPSQIEGLFAKLAAKVQSEGLAEARRFLIAEYGSIIRPDLRTSGGLSAALSQASVGDAGGQFLLRRIEQSLWNDQEIHWNLGSPRQVHLEHILPQEPAEDEWDPKWLDEDYHASYAERLGNLTLLGQRLNQGARNRSFDTKKTTYYSRSDLKVNIVLRNLGSWDEAAITARGAELAAKAEQLWGWPTVSASEA